MDDWSPKALAADPMRVYRAKRDSEHKTVASLYQILGFISSGTYGRVYKAKCNEDGMLYAIKKFKPDKEGDATTYTGISQSAIREIAVSASLVSRYTGRLGLTILPIAQPGDFA
jgi:cyclin-dependent kinase 8/11